MNKVNGFLYGLLSSASFGLIPLFTIPAMHQGMQFWSILLYRFFFAMLALAGILLLDKQSFRIRRKEILPLLLLAFLYDCSAVFLFWGYKFMSSGVATTIHFMYPVLTTLTMMLFFREKKSIWRIAAILLAVSGVFFLSHGDTTGTVTLWGILCLSIWRDSPFHRDDSNRRRRTSHPGPDNFGKPGNAGISTDCYFQSCAGTRY